MASWKPPSFRAELIVLLALGTVGVLVVVALIVKGVLKDPQSSEPFAGSSSWYAKIPPDAMVDPNSPAMIARVTRGKGDLVANMVEYGIPIYEADSSTPRHRVDCRVKDWGPCPFAGLDVPIPDGAFPHSGSDGAMVVVDNQERKVYEFWQVRQDGDTWSASFGAVNNLDGSGWGGSGTGSGASRLAGVVRLAEIEQGHIPHALALQSDNVCATEFRPPAIRTDGVSERPDCIPEGARLRLDPSLDLTSLRLTPGELAVATAMQTYGGYVIDNGGAELSMSFELDTEASEHLPLGETYSAAEFRWDYDGMTGVPWDRLEVLA